MIILDEFGNPYPDDAFPPPPDINEPVLGFTRVFGKGDLEGLTFDIKKMIEEMEWVAPIYSKPFFLVAGDAGGVFGTPVVGPAVVITITKETHSNGKPR